MRKGFTLIELLVVIAIIAILAAILFPVFARARAKAQQNNCLSNIKQLQMSLMMYASDNSSAYPLDTVGTGNSQVNWPTEVMIYTKNVQIFLCPTDATTTGSIVFTGTSDTVTHLSYGRNSAVSANSDAWLFYPSEMLGVIDAVAFAIPANNTLAVAQSDIALSGNVNNTRHNLGCNQSYMDGHAKWIAFASIPDPASGTPPPASAAKHYWLGID
jgi:prepilin-type N-terminal cleavage/methylation domain-containing protein/prepilin-type processing-associated H-X9-DG protein